jgi:hypothetical protein
MNSIERYNAIFENLQEKVNKGEITLEDAQKVNDMAYDKYVFDDMFEEATKELTSEQKAEIKAKRKKLKKTLIKATALIAATATAIVILKKGNDVIHAEQLESSKMKLQKIVKDASEFINSSDIKNQSDAETYDKKLEDFYSKLCNQAKEVSSYTKYAKNPDVEKYNLNDFMDQAQFWFALHRV